MPSQHGASISLCMIVRNEERNLEACLAPVAHLFDEIVIVDTGSTDHTREIAQKYTQHVFSFPWCDNFAAARNETLKHSHGDWIFWLDADDRILPDDVAKLSEALNQLNHEHAVYQINTVCHGKYECDGVQHLTHARLFRRHEQLRWNGRVHEQLVPPPHTLGFKNEFLNVQIHHVGYADDSQRLKKQQRDIRLLRMDFATDPEDTSTVFHLALAYARVGNIPEAKRFLQILLDRDLPWQDWQRRMYELLGEFAMREGNIQLGLQYTEIGLMKFPNDLPLMYLRAQLFYEVDGYPQCEHLLLTALSQPKDATFSGGSPGELRERKIPWLLAETWKQQGRQSEAIVLLEQTLTHYPEDLQCWWSLGSNCLTAGQLHKLPAIYTRMLELPNGEPFALALQAQSGMYTNQLAGLAEKLDRLIEIAPNMPIARLLRAEFLFRSQAPLDQYLAACRDVLRVFPGHAAVSKEVKRLEQILANQQLLASGQYYSPVVVSTM